MSIRCDAIAFFFAVNTDIDTMNWPQITWRQTWWTDCHKWSIITIIQWIEKVKHHHDRYVPFYYFYIYLVAWRRSHSPRYKQTERIEWVIARSSMSLSERGPLNNVWLMLIDNNWLLIVVHVNCCGAGCTVTQHVADCTVALNTNQMACSTSV